MELTVAAFAVAHRGLSRQEFLSRVVDPHLLVTRAPAPTVTPSPFSTITLPALRALTRPGDPSLLAVRKRPGSNPFALMITVGRAANNDLVLHDSSVSKLHCYFHRYGGVWTLCDPGSTNGTFVDGARAREAGVPLRSGCLVRVGDAYQAVFVEPVDLHAMLTGARPLPQVEPLSSVG